MRLDKRSAGSAEDSLTHQFNNLKNVTIDFDQEHWVTVVIGWNGTGKSNVLKALALIFRDLIAKKRKPAFAFQLAYRMGAGESLRHIHIDADPDREKDVFLVRVANAKQIKHSELTHSLLDLCDDYIARQVLCVRILFSYYSGERLRMHEVFRPYMESYDSKLRNGDDPGLKRLFYVMPVHSRSATSIDRP